MYQIIGTWAVTLHNCNIKAQAMSLNLAEVYKRVPVDDLDNNTNTSPWIGVLKLTKSCGRSCPCV